MTKTQIIIAANTKRLEELRLELNRRRLELRRYEGENLAEAQKLRLEIKNLESIDSMDLGE